MPSALPKERILCEFDARVGVTSNSHLQDWLSAGLLAQWGRNSQLTHR